MDVAREVRVERRAVMDFALAGGLLLAVVVEVAVEVVELAGSETSEADSQSASASLGIKMKVVVGTIQKLVPGGYHKQRNPGARS